MSRGRSGHGVVRMAIGVALTLGLSFEAAAEAQIALTEVGVDQKPVTAGCGPRGRKGAEVCATRAPAPVRVARPLFAIVSIADQTVSIYNHDGLVVRSPVSTGMPGHSTPKGVFTIIGRERFHASNLYSGAPMPFMQRLTWSGVAMHVGVVPGHPASHGCIRLPEAFAMKLWGMTRIGERVVVAPDDVTPTEITHPLLPAPKMQVVADAGPAAVSTASETGAPVVVDQTRLNPRQYAERLREKAKVDRIAAVKTATEASRAVDAAKVETARLTRDVEAARLVAVVAQKKLEAAEKALHEAEAAAAASPLDFALARAQDEAATAKAKIAEEGAVAAAKLDAAMKAEAAGVTAASDAEARLRAAGEAVEAAKAVEKEAGYRTEPVSVLISKADKRVYVRQGLAPVFDAPASIRDPASALGSHLYIATAAGDDGVSLKWSVVSLPAQRTAEPRKKETAEDELYGSSSYTPLSSSAEEALERVEISPDVRDKIAERLWTGGSLIISDLPLSGETSNIGTDLTIKLR
jgi:hypothetical protein